MGMDISCKVGTIIKRKKIMPIECTKRKKIARRTILRLKSLRIIAANKKSM